jgi:hypothetical protein
MDNFLKLAVAVNDSKGLLSVGNVLPSLSPMKLLGFSLGKSLQSFREGKLISLTEIMGSHNRVMQKISPIPWLLL